jgi:hypothetical protein
LPITPQLLEHLKRIRSSTVKRIVKRIQQDAPRLP